MRNSLSSARLPSIALLGLILLLGSCQRQKAFYYRSIRIDTGTLVAELVDPFPGGSPYPPNEPYYSYFFGHDGVSIYHFSGQTAGGFAHRFNAFGADFDKRLSQRTKQQELLSGPFGRVFTRTTYFYRDFFGELRGSEFSVSSYSKRCEYEPVQVVERMPVPTPQLSAVSLVRVFKATPEFLVATATYGPDGNLRWFQVDASKGGDWVHPSEFGEMIVKHSAHRERFGVPEKVSVMDYQERPGPIWSKASLQSTLDVVNFHYDYNRWVRQDQYDSEGKRSTRFLAYVVTEEDRILEPIDRAKPLGTYARPHE